VNPQQVLPRAKISLEAKALRDLVANTKGQLARRNDSSCPVTKLVTLSDNSIGESKIDSRAYPSSVNRGPGLGSQGIRRRQRARTISMIASILILAAAGYSLLYLLLGGGLGGAILIFVVAKMLGR
jgi:hypothetical protein